MISNLPKSEILKLNIELNVKMYEIDTPFAKLNIYLMHFRFNFSFKIQHIGKQVTLVKCSEQQKRYLAGLEHH